MGMHLERLTCPVCNAAKAQPVRQHYAVEPWHLLECAECSMVWIGNPPASSELEEELAWEKTYAADVVERTSRNATLYKLGRLPKALMQRLLRRDKLLALVKSYIQPGPLLDVGCADGKTLASFPGCYTPHGVEISKELSRISNALYASRGGGVMQGDAPVAIAQFPSGYFSGVLMISYLEHETRTSEVLRAAREVMRDRARLVVKVPNYGSWNRMLRGKRWCGFRFPAHVNYFTPQTLQNLLHETGFGVLRFSFTERMPTADTMWLVAEAV